MRSGWTGVVMPSGWIGVVTRSRRIGGVIPTGRDGYWVEGISRGWSIASGVGWNAGRRQRARSPSQGRVHSSGGPRNGCSAAGRV